MRWIRTFKEDLTEHKTAYILGGFLFICALSAGWQVRLTAGETAGFLSRFAPVDGQMLTILMRRILFWAAVVLMGVWAVGVLPGCTAVLLWAALWGAKWRLVLQSPAGLPTQLLRAAAGTIGAGLCAAAVCRLLHALQCQFVRLFAERDIPRTGSEQLRRGSTLLWESLPAMGLLAAEALLEGIIGKWLF